MRHLLTIISAILLFTACSKDDDNGPDPIDYAQRTVIVYMAGNNELSSYVQEDINEMKEGCRSVSPSENLVVFVNHDGTAVKPFIAKVTTDGELQTLYTYEENISTADPDALRDAIERAVEFCPAKEYGLVLWGHANGWIIEKDSIATNGARRAYGADTSSGKKLWLNIPSLRESLQLLPFKWKFIMCDCCNMLNVEAAYELKDLTEYFIGSPAEIPGKGAPYDKIVPTLYLQTEDFYKTVIDTYAAEYPYDSRKETGKSGVVLAAIKMSEMNRLAEATKHILPQLNTYSRETSLKATGHTYYHAIKVNDKLHSILHDMREVAFKALDNYSYDNWMSAFNAAVVYSHYSPRWITNGTVQFEWFDKNDPYKTQAYWGGLSMFFPMDRYGTAPDGVNATIKQMGWYYAVGWSEVGW